MSFNTFPRWIAALSLVLMLLLVGCATEAASGAPYPSLTPAFTPAHTIAPPPVRRLTRTPNPTVEMEKSIEAVAYIINWEYKTGFDYLCDNYSLEKRIWDWEDDLTRLELRSTDESYIGTAKWHKEIRALARELETLVAYIDRECIG